MLLWKCFTTLRKKVKLLFQAQYTKENTDDKHEKELQFLSRKLLKSQN